jgi:O-methyltransferase/methyltransferase family protein
LTSPANQKENEIPVQAQMLQFITNFWTSRAVYIVAKLGIADLLQSGPKTAEELARATETDPSSLYRIMRALASVGLFQIGTDQQFALTPMSETLVTGAPGSVRWFMISELGQEHYPAWGNLMHSVKTGEIAFDNFFGMDVWKYFAQNPEDAAVFNDSMSGMTAAANEAILSLFDFSSFKTVVDVGGGHGGLITTILKANPNAKGILFDAPQVVEGAPPKLEQAGVADRCEVVAGDFFKAVPAGGDAYVMKWIIHDWEDEKAITILKNCRAQMKPDARLIIVDCVVPEGNEPHFAKTFDLNMMVMTGGKERTAAEFEKLVSTAGFKLLQVIPTELPTGIVVAEPA